MIEFTVIVDCPYCGEIEDDVVAFHPLSLEPVILDRNCRACNKDYKYKGEIEVEVHCYTETKGSPRED